MCDGTDVGTATAANAVGEAESGRRVEVAGADAARHFQRQQAHRASPRAAAAADAGAGRGNLRLTGIEGEDADAPLTIGTLACGRTMPIIGPPSTSRAGRPLTPAKRSRSTTRVPSGAMKLPGRVQRAAVDGDDAFDQRFADGATHDARQRRWRRCAPARRLRRRGVGRDFLAGQGLDQLLVRTHRVARRHRPHMDVRKRCGGDRMAAIASGLLSSMPTSASRAPMACIMMRRPSIDDFGCAVAHDAVVGRQIGLAFAAIDDQRTDLEAAAEIDFDRRRESGAAEADDAGGGGQPGDLLGRQREGIAAGARSTTRRRRRRRS
jgi:hypothetical protein